MARGTSRRTARPPYTAPLHTTTPRATIDRRISENDESVIRERRPLLHQQRMLNIGSLRGLVPWARNAINTIAGAHPRWTTDSDSSESGSESQDEESEEDSDNNDASSSSSSMHCTFLFFLLGLFREVRREEEF